jgi:nucleoside-diphosphate-sugar epimerase
VNIVGAMQIFEWAATLPELKTFVYVGTAWICGTDKTHRIVCEPESPNEAFTQLVEYSRSKSIGEINVRNIIPSNKLLVVRPSTIIGDSRNWTPRSYSILWAIAAFDMMRLVAMNPTASQDVIPVDYASEAIVKLLFVKRKYNTYHISSGTKSASTMKLFLEAVNIQDRPPYEFVDYKLINQIKLFSKNKLSENSELIKTYGLYTDYWKKIFGDNGNLRMLLGGVDFYFQFANLGLTFDNTRLLMDTDIGYSEPVHQYMARNKLQLRKIDVLEGATNP